MSGDTEREPEPGILRDLVDGVGGLAADLFVYLLPGLLGAALGLTALTTAALLEGYPGPTAFAQANAARAGVILLAAVALVEVGRQAWGPA